MKNETSREVPCCGGRYVITLNSKEVKCISLNYNHTGIAKEMSNKPNGKNGRIYWNLCVNGEQKSRQAAVWIAITFPELVQNEYFEGAEIDHIIPLSVGGTNHPTNLRWVTRKENLNNVLTRKHMSKAQKGKILTEKSKHKLSEANKGKWINRKDQSKPVLHYDNYGNFLGRYDSAHEASRQTGILRPNITKWCLGKCKPIDGTIWKYENN